MTRKQPDILSQQSNEKLDSERKFGWDKGVNFEKMRKELEKIYKDSYGNNIKDEVYSAVLLIQLVNGSRIGEAVKTFYNFVLSQGRIREFEIKAEKRGNVRKMYIPEIIKYRQPYLDEIIDRTRNSISNPLEALISEEKFRNRVIKWAERKLHINTHSLRYSYITYLSKKSVSPQVIAKITGHKKLDRIIEYTQTIEADEIQKQIVDEK